ncbi:ABC transporter substrate-binding protein [Candidatus Frankia alpina]|uniref:ABC transporter substrate-binding protein n=1 Tax=Candidatus Frankia alpina TaxID=2699483 RepID=UPI001F425E3B|nr:ABC transporter substrate-binding protein [Candidatus Frankia alpina]
MVIGDLTSTIPFKVPEVVPVARGVLRGFPNVRIETCDAKGTSGGYQICARQAITEKVAGVIQGFVTAQDQTALTKAGIPMVGVSDDTSPNSFPVSSSFALYVSLGVGLANTGCTRLGIVYLDGSDFLIDYIKRGFESRGGKEVARAPVAANAADLSPAVAKLTGAGATCVAVSLVPSGAAQALTALRQSGRTLTIGGLQRGPPQLAGQSRQRPHRRRQPAQHP